MSAFFIERPVFAWVIAILIVLAGSLAVSQLAVEAYPEIAPPTVTVTGNYPGASAEVIESSVTTVIEQQLTGLNGLLFFSSTSSSSGSITINLSFENGTDIDIAAVEVQNRISRAEPRLPQQVREQGLTVAKAAAGFLMVIALQSDTMGETDLNNIVSSQVLDPIQRIKGVGGAVQFGAEFSMRIWLDPGKLQGYGLSASEVLEAVRAQNVQFASGSVGSAPAVPGQGLTASVSAESRFSDPEQFRQIILRSSGEGATVRLGDVARVEVGAQTYSRSSRYNGKPVAAFALQLLPGANALQVAEAAKARMDELSTSWPAGVNWIVPFDSSTFVSISIEEVVWTLVEAFVLVFLVILLFLQNLRATIVPMLVVPVAILGAFAGMYLVGFSINVLSLFGLVLAIGIVVDDAIVVVENVERIMEQEGLPPKQATQKSMTQITGAIVAVSVVLAAVFIPSAMMSGSVGAIYRQFALTIAISMFLSATMALVFTPALCATMLHKPEHRARNRLLQMFNRGFERTANGYVARVASGIRHTPRWLVVYGAVILGCVFVFWRLPASFLPAEDQGNALAIVQLPSGATIERTREVQARVLEQLRKSPIFKSAMQVSGFSFLGQGENVGMSFVRFTDWSERDMTAEEFIGWANESLASIKEAQIFMVNLPTIRGLGQFSGFDFRLQDRGGLGAEQLAEAWKTVVAKANQNPVLSGVRFNGLADSPQLHLEVDRTQAQAMGLSVSDVYTAIQLMLAPVYANEFNYGGRVLRVQLQADAPFRMKPEDLSHYRVRNNAGEMIPLDSVVKATWTVGPPSRERYNGLASAPLTGDAAPGHSSGEAMAAMAQIVRDELPNGFGFEWSGQSLQEILSGQQAPFLFAVSIVVVFLCLAALYESWSIPVAVLLVVPVGVLGALLFTYARGLPNDIYFKVGLLAIIGLAAKNAILIIAFARDAQLEGRSLYDAILEACKLRFRPIVMTSLAFVLGVVPLAVSTGAGANSRHAIGTGVIGGMVAATTLGLLLVPVFYVVIRRLLGDRHPEEAAPRRDVSHF